MLHITRFDDMFNADLWQKATVQKCDGSTVTGLIVNVESGYDTDDGYGVVDLCELENRRVGIEVSEKDFIGADIDE